MKRYGSSSTGFSLVELLVVVAIMGLVVMAVMGVYESTQRTAYSQDEVVELQQNLRVALEQISKDLRMAGFMIPTDDVPIDIAPQNPTTANRFTINTASAAGRAIRLDVDLTVPEASDPDGNADTVRFTVGSSDMIDLFDAGDQVRIIRPPAQDEPLPATFIVTATDRPNQWITLSGFTAPLGGGTEEYKSGDVIALTSGSALPNTVAYYLEGGEIKRSPNGGAAQVVASDISALAMAYLMDNGTEDIDGVTGTDLDNIRAVRVTITGQVTTLEGVSTRTLSNVVKLRNR